MSFFRDLIEAVVPAAYAEEAEDVEEEQPDVSKKDDEDDSEDSEETGDSEEGGDDEDEDDEDEDDEDEDEAELVDPLDTLRDECKDTPACKPFNHHFHECVERVTKEQEEDGYDQKHYKEDCIEEFFHLNHCINDCVAPRLFYHLK